MNLKEKKKGDIGCILAAVIALLFCVYAAIVSLGGIKEASAANVANKTPKITLVDEKIARLAADEAAIEAQEAADQVVEEEVISNTDVVAKVEEIGSLAEPAALKKTVVLLDNFGEKFGEVCFEAADESVFMSYGWVGLAEQALAQTGENRDIDAIKMELNDNCKEYAGQSVLLSYNPIAAPMVNEGL